MALGRKTGGRTKGTPNVKTAEQVAAVEASGLMPLDYMLGVMRNENEDAVRRLDAAKSAAPYVHARLSLTTLKGDEENPVGVRVIERRIVDPVPRGGSGD
jgi:hypothetical protein